MKQFFLYAVLLLGVIVAISAYNASNNVTLPTSSGAAQPVRLRIKKLHIDAAVMNVGQTADGKMAAPSSQAINSPYWSRVFWYEPGTAPGQRGNAVIAGHVDRVGGDPAIFWSLHLLKAGDSIEIITTTQQTLYFRVDRTVNYPASTSNSDVLRAIFGPSTGHHLNLITCSGTWTKTGYDQRLVVFTTQVL